MGMEGRGSVLLELDKIGFVSSLVEFPGDPADLRHVRRGSTIELFRKYFYSLFFDK